jgi:hypothetical protein
LQSDFKPRNQGRDIHASTMDQAAEAEAAAKGREGEEGGCVACLPVVRWVDGMLSARLTLRG